MAQKLPWSPADGDRFEWALRTYRNWHPVDTKTSKEYWKLFFYHWEEQKEILNRAAAYIFSRSGASWTEQQKITASDGIVRYRFGDKVAISQDGQVVLAAGGGAHPDDVDPGAVYVFLRGETMWAEWAKLSSTSWGPRDNFGSSLAVNQDGTIALIAARGSTYDNPTLYGGAAFIFEAQEGQKSWIERYRFTTPKYGQFSFARYVALNAQGNVALVGNFDEGAYVYEMDPAASVVFLPLVLK